jgi:hypothetical protein
LYDADGAVRFKLDTRDTSEVVEVLSFRRFVYDPGTHSLMMMMTGSVTTADTSVARS